MFKLTKIINSGVSVPETEALPVAEGTPLKVGCALKREGEYLVAAGEADAPEYILTGKVDAKSGYALVYEVFDNMIFAVTLDGDEYVKAGDTVKLSVKAGVCAAVTKAENGRGTVVRVGDGCVYVRFNK